MGRSCFIVPHIRNAKNELVESRLAANVLALLRNDMALGENKSTREQKLSVYSQIISKHKNGEFRAICELDENNEPVFGDVIVACELQYALDDKKVQAKLKKDCGNQLEDTFENEGEILERAKQFNETNDLRGLYTAQMEVRDGKVYMVTELTNQDSQKKFEDSVKAHNLNRLIRNKLSDAGVSVGAYDNLVSSIMANGVTDFSAAHSASTGLVELIKIAKGIRGENVLPEEFSHFVLECLRDTNLAQRIIDFVENNNLAEEILGDRYDAYYERYDGNEEQLAFEAASEIVRLAIMENAGLEIGSLSNLAERLANQFREKFSQMSEIEIQQIIDGIVETSRSFAQAVMTNNMLIHRSMVKHMDMYYNLATQVERETDLLHKIIDNEIKRKSTYAKVHTAEEAKVFASTQDKFINELISNDEDAKRLLGIYSFMVSANTRMLSLVRSVNDITSRAKISSLHEVAILFDDVKQTTDSYKYIVKDLHELIANYRDVGNIVFDTTNGKKLSELIGSLSANITYLQNVMYAAIKPYVTEFFNPLVTDAIKNFNYGVDKNGNHLKGLEVLDDNEASIPDISIADRWLHSMANSSDIFNKLFDKAVKIRKNNIRQRVIRFQDNIKYHAKQLRDAGYTDFGFVYERDDDGNKTSYFISEVNLSQYYKDRRKFFDEYIKSKGLTRHMSQWTKEQRDEFDKANAEFMKETVTYHGKTKSRGIFISLTNEWVPNQELYHNDEWDKLSEEQKTFVKYLSNEKKKFDTNYLPLGEHQAKKVPIILKDTLERLEGDGIIGIKTLVKESIRDTFEFRSDDDEFGYLKTDYTGKPIERLPIYYTHLRQTEYNEDGTVKHQGDDPNQITDDIVSSMCAYAYMAINFEEMSSILPELEMCRAYIDNRINVQMKHKGRVGRESFNWRGESYDERPVYKVDESNAKAQRDDWFSAIVYGRYFKNDGTMNVFGKEVSVQKLINGLTKWTSIRGMTLNPLMGIANLEQGLLMSRVESAGQRYFSFSDIQAADKAYWSMMSDYAKEIGSNYKTNKLHLLSQKFDILQEYDREIKDIGYDRHNLLKKMFGDKFLYMFTNAGEHMIQHRTFFAMTNSEKERVYDTDGSRITISDAYDVVPINDEDESAGSKLVMKRGLKFINGKTIITFEQQQERRNARQTAINSDTEISEEDVIAYYSYKSAGINHRLHGIYNTLDRSASQSTAIGSLGLLFRKWVVSSIDNRYKKKDIDPDLNDEVEGYYRTLARLLKEIKNEQFKIATAWDKMDAMERANCRKAFKELGIFATILTTIGLLHLINGGGDDKRKERPWVVNYVIDMLSYSTYRMRTEIGALLPGPTILSEGLKLVKSPFPEVALGNTIMQSINILLPWQYMNEYQSGKYKGHSKAYKAWVELFPWTNDIMNVIDLSDATSFYKNPLF